MVYALCCDLCVWLQEMEDYGSTLSIYEHELLILRQATENICRIEEDWTRSALKVVFVSSGHPPYCRSVCLDTFAFFFFLPTVLPLLV